MCTLQSSRHKFTAHIKRKHEYLFDLYLLHSGLNFFQRQQMSNFNALFHLKSTYTLQAIGGPSRPELIPVSMTTRDISPLPQMEFAFS